MTYAYNVCVCMYTTRWCVCESIFPVDYFSLLLLSPPSIVCRSYGYIYIIYVSHHIKRIPILDPTKRSDLREPVGLISYTAVGNVLRSSPVYACIRMCVCVCMCAPQALADTNSTNRMDRSFREISFFFFWFWFFFPPHPMLLLYTPRHHPNLLYTTNYGLTTEHNTHTHICAYCSQVLTCVCTEVYKKPKY